MELELNSSRSFGASQGERFFASGPHTCIGMENMISFRKGMQVYFESIQTERSATGPDE